jgi:hypothetical protein
MPDWSHWGSAAVSFLSGNWVADAIGVLLLLYLVWQFLNAVGAARHAADELSAIHSEIFDMCRTLDGIKDTLESIDYNTSQIEPNTKRAVED